MFVIIHFNLIQKKAWNIRFLLHSSAYYEIYEILTCFYGTLPLKMNSFHKSYVRISKISLCTFVIAFKSYISSLSYNIKLLKQIAKSKEIWYSNLEIN